MMTKCVRNLCMVLCHSPKGKIYCLIDSFLLLVVVGVVSFGVRVLGWDHRVNQTHVVINQILFYDLTMKSISYLNRICKIDMLIK